MRREHFRGVIWPRPKADGKHRYVVVGMLVTDEPIAAFEGKNDVVLDGGAFAGVAAALEALPQKEAGREAGRRERRAAQPGAPRRRVAPGSESNGRPRFRETATLGDSPGAGSLRAPLLRSRRCAGVK